MIHTFKMGFPGGSASKESTCNAGDTSLIPGSGRSPGEGKWQPTPVFLPGNSHGQKHLVGYSVWDCKRVGQDLVAKQKLLRYENKQEGAFPTCSTAYRQIVESNSSLVCVAQANRVQHLLNNGVNKWTLYLSLVPFQAALSAMKGQHRSALTQGVGQDPSPPVSCLRTFKSSLIFSDTCEPGLILMLCWSKIG